MKAFFRNLRIRSKLLGGYTLIFILVAILCNGVIYYTVRSTIEANIESELTNSTAMIFNMVRTAAGTSIKNHLRAVAEKNKEIIEHIYQDYQNGLFSEEEAKSRARNILFSQTIGKTGYIFCANTRGIAVEHPNPGVVGKNFLDHGFVREMIRLKQGYLEYDWKNPEDDHEKPKAMYMSHFEPWDWIIAASSYREEFKELVKISDFKDSILSLKFGKTGYAYITDSQGNLIVHPFLTGNYYDDKDSNAFVRKICTMKTGKLVYSWKNPRDEREREKMVIFNYIPEYDWIIASTSYLDEIFSPLKTIRHIIVTTVFLILALVFSSSLWINSTIIKPLKSLMNRLSAGASGNLAGRMQVTSRDEIGQLAGYFNLFMERLEIYSTSLKAEIDQHRKTEEALWISQEKYRRILERMEEGYFEVDFSGRFTFFNLSMETLLKASKDTLPEKKIHEFMDTENSEKLNRLFKKIRASGLAVQVSDLEMVKSDGSPCSVETSVSLLLDPDQRPAGFSGVLRDVSDRKKSEKALKLSEELFSKAFRSSPSGMFIASVKDTKIINVNDGFLKITGYSLFDLIGKELKAIRFFYTPSEGAKILDGIIKNNPLQPLEFKFLNSAGEVRTGLISVEIVDVWGERCMLAAMEDMTESRELEKEILNISERERRKIAMELHDDLCPHLIGIEVLTKILKERLESKALDEARNADKIRALILESIDKTRRLSRGLFPINLAEHGFHSSLQELSAQVREMFGLSCEVACPLSFSFKDNAVSTHLYYIMHEAVHNAVKHARAHHIHIRLTDRVGRIGLTIRDDGTGISDLDRVQGMGIKIMKYRAARIGASLDIFRDPGGGTRVVLEMEKEPEF
jgi:PAS domain S-box-containing protein